MRKTILTAIAAFTMGGIATGAVLSQAQPAPPPGPMMQLGADEQHEMGRDHPPMPWLGRRHGGPMHFLRTFGLIYRQPDRALSPADVQKIAEAVLLWNGNHSWKVSTPAANPDGLIGFELTTQDGSPIAKFTMDPHTAKLVRAG